MTLKQKRLQVLNPQPLKRKPWVSFFSGLPMVFKEVGRFLPCQPMDRLPKKEATQKTKKTKVEKSKPHLLNP